MHCDSEGNQQSVPPVTYRLADASDISGDHGNPERHGLCEDQGQSLGGAWQYQHVRPGIERRNVALWTSKRYGIDVSLGHLSLELRSQEPVSHIDQ